MQVLRLGTKVDIGSEKLDAFIIALYNIPTMENFNQDQDQNQSPVPEPVPSLADESPSAEDNFEESKIMNDIPQENGWWALMKRSAVFVLLCLVIIGSFWVSFNLGKRLLVPVKKDIPKVEAVIPEPPAAILELQELEKGA